MQRMPVRIVKTGDRDLDAWVSSMVALNRAADRAERRQRRYDRAVALTVRRGGSRWDVPFPVPANWPGMRRYMPTLEQVQNLQRERDPATGRFLTPDEPAPHGTIARYQRPKPGCRCPDCCDAWRAYFRALMRKRAGKTAEEYRASRAAA